MTLSVIDSNHFWPEWSLLLTKSTWCSTPSRWPWPQTRVSRGSDRTRRMVNALTRIDPDLVPLWTNLDRAELYQLTSALPTNSLSPGPTVLSTTI